MRTLIAIIVTFIIALLSALALATKATGHGWYDAECCSDQDCAPVIESRPHVLGGRMKGRLMTSKHGTTFVPDAAPRRQSKDWQTHVCMRVNTQEYMDHVAPPKDDTELKTFLCIYEPMAF